MVRWGGGRILHENATLGGGGSLHGSQRRQLFKTAPYLVIKYFMEGPYNILLGNKKLILHGRLQGPNKSGGSIRLTLTTQGTDTEASF